MIRLLVLLLATAAASPAAPPAATPAATSTNPGLAAAVPPPPPESSDCLPTGDGYLRARLAGALEARIDWPNAGTVCQGESKTDPDGVRMSFKRSRSGKPNLLFLFGLTGVREGAPARNSGVNLTLIVQGTPRIYGTLGDARCTVDSLTQTPLKPAHSFRVEARGFCTQPAHAVHGDGDVLVSTFEFAGRVDYGD